MLEKRGIDSLTQLHLYLTLAYFVRHATLRQQPCSYLIDLETVIVDFEWKFAIFLGKILVTG